MTRLTRILTIAALTTAAGCSSKPEETPPPRTPEQQRAVDSTIGASALPGAGGVRNALAASDSAKAKAAQLDSLAKAP